MISKKSFVKNEDWNFWIKFKFFEWRLKNWIPKVFHVSYFFFFGYFFFGIFRIIFEKKDWVKRFFQQTKKKNLKSFFENILVAFLEFWLFLVQWWREKQSSVSGPNEKHTQKTLWNKEINSFFFSLSQFLLVWESSQKINKSHKKKSSKHFWGFVRARGESIVEISHLFKFFRIWMMKFIRFFNFLRTFPKMRLLRVFSVCRSETGYFPKKAQCHFLFQYRKFQLYIFYIYTPFILHII